jgi:hypothetical protein
MNKDQSTSSAGEHSKGTANDPKINLDNKLNSAENHSKKNDQDLYAKGLLLVKPASCWIDEAKSRPIPKMLFSEFWHEGELCILFADTNVGKSILAVQIGNSIAIAEPIDSFKLEAAKQKVLYFDFEMSDKQFENRYSIEYSDHYHFDENFLRVEINPDAAIPNSLDFEQYLFHSFERAIIETGAKVLVIDNITYLKTETERAKDALPLMKHLNALKKKYGLSILALAHTPKRDRSRPLTPNDVQGSKMLMNFCDSSFAIGASAKDGNLRYLKQIKQRTDRGVYEGDNVCVCSIEKPHNFLQFQFNEFATEREHLRHMTEEEIAVMNASVIEMHKKGFSYREIAKEFGISHTTARRIVGRQDS